MSVLKGKHLLVGLNWGLADGFWPENWSQCEQVPQLGLTDPLGEEGCSA